jgi:myosin-5
MLSLSNNGTRVWVKASAIEATQTPKLTFAAKIARSRSIATPSLVQTPSETESDVGSSVLGSISHGRSQWGWKRGWMLENSDGCMAVRVDEVNEQGDDSFVINSGSNVVTLAASALNDGDVVLANEYTPTGSQNPVIPDDLITLTHLHEPAVVECLQLRYSEDIIYTATGPVLLALNPFQTLRGLYGEATMRKYWEKAERSSKELLQPHVYAIADNSFRNMMRKLEDCLGMGEAQGCNQSILVSGESGAGKTVTTKFVMKYLAALSQRAATQIFEKRAYVKAAEMKTKVHSNAAVVSPSRTSSSRRATVTSQPSWALNISNANNSKLLQLLAPKDVFDRRDSSLSNVATLTGSTSNSIESQVLQSNPILESFGNARTVRNDNSSRFGKFIEIQFTRSGKLVGAQIETYLLEKVRLVTQSPGERNYHIFFELLSGAIDARELRQYFLASTAAPEDFRITNSGTYDRRDGVTDKETYRALRNAMNTMKFPAEEQRDVFAITAAILHASNLTFNDHGESSSLDDNNVHLEPVCYLLGVTPTDLNQALCFSALQAGRETQVQRSLPLFKAQKGLEALLKATYGALFSYLVKRINDSVAYSEKLYLEESGQPNENLTYPWSRPAASIGVLDIFGFESFTKNSFEQLCINYCNEALQQQFNAFVLKNEQAEYEREGIEWSFIEFPENQDVLDLIDKRGSGILNILDDQCRAPGTTDRSFAADVYSKCKDQPRFSVNRRQTAIHQFEIHHYAGPVEYSTDGFVEKNRDELPKESIELLKHSSNPFVHDLAGIIENSSGCVRATCDDNTMLTPYKLHRADSSVVTRSTVGGQFRRQLRDLRTKIDLTSPHYIRCLKPNDHLIPENFDAAIVAEQLRCGGILEAVRVSRAGFTQHYPHADFIKRYRSLAKRELRGSESCGPKGSSSSNNAWNTLSPAAGWNGVVAGAQRQKKWEPPRNAAYRNASQPRALAGQGIDSDGNDFSEQCKTLIKVLYKKLHGLDKEESQEYLVDCHTTTDVRAQLTSCMGTSISQTPTKSKGEKASHCNVRGTDLPTPSSASILPRYAPWQKVDPQQVPPTTRNSPAHLSFRLKIPNSDDWTKVGIQLGRTKVFLRHKAFEALERMRSNAQAKAATQLNSFFRMFLARMAYLSIREAYRVELWNHQNLGELDDQFKETKEQEYEDGGWKSFGESGKWNGLSSSISLVDNWQIRFKASIHNPVPRSEWGKQAPLRAYNFKWVLVEGIWIRNWNSASDEEA